ncbi:hypothetical protein LIER_35689 [Lithospermum erythrorhizon]|uniref:Uncharacterized protein n=1 Tax=Lithospermum erythrorhizon TaxID=34254 RepID=A0AAV3NUS7_LITER
MGTKVQYKSCFGGYNSMRDLNDDLNGNCWPFFSGENNIPSYTRFIPRTAANSYPGYDKNALKQKMLEHESTFKNQVHELHRLYRIQRDMMEEIKSKEHCRHRGSVEPSSSSSIQGSKVPANDVQKFHHRGYPFEDSCYPRSTVSGAENGNSSFSYKKGNSTVASRVASHGFHKEFEVSEARPSKVRKKSFDLQLPADEYVDTEDDERQDNNISADPNFAPIKEYKTNTESSMKLSVGGLEMCGLKEGCSSVSHFRSFTGLADLNEPIAIEEVTESSPANIFGHSDCNGSAIHKSIHGNQMSSLNSMSTENKINGREWFPYSYLADPSKEVSRKERLGRGLAASHSILDYSNHNHLEPVMGSQVSNAFPFKNSSNDASTWPQLMQSLGTPADSLKSKLTAFHNQPSLGSSPSLNKGLQGSALNNHIPGYKWHVNSSFHSNPSLASDLPSHNGFYQGSSSGSKVLPVCFSSITNNTASMHMKNGMEKAFLSSSFVDIKPLKDMNLNETFPKNALDMPVILRKPEVHQHSLPWIRTKPAFINEATSSRREVIYIDSSPPRASPKLLSGKSKAMIDLNQIYNESSASNNHIRSKKETNGISSVKKILGVPIFEKLGVSENTVSTFMYSTTEAEHAKHERKSRSIDINVACDDALLGSEETVMDEVFGENVDKSSCARNLIDLNTYVAEDEDPPVPTVASTSGLRKIVVEIDLEAPAVPEEEDSFLHERDREQEHDITPRPAENDTEHAENEAIRSAAEAIVNISSCQHINQEKVICPPSDAEENESLLWFADVVSSASTFGKEGSYKVMDDFEAMTLQLPEIKEGDFMTKPFIPEVQKVDETGATALPNRPRRGQARRGRQRRDFQRDILPGLVSLSRLEVTEDLQTFGGLMRAMGHSWNSGMTRRNGGRNGSGRGRRRKVVETASEVLPVAAASQLVQQLDNVEPSLEDRSLTSWGKMTRRPRRQRCPVGNAPTIALT